MKKQILLFSTAICLSLSSCGGKNDDKQVIKEETKEQIVLTNDCDCNELENLADGKKISKSGTKELFTGICFEKDQNDSILKKVDIKNGWITRKVMRKKVSLDKYLTYEDYIYDNGKRLDGYNIDYKEDEGIGYVSKYFVQKNGKEVEDKSWRFEFKYSGSFLANTIYDEQYQPIENQYEKGMILNYSINSNNYKLEDPTKYLPSFEKITNDVDETYIDKTPTIQERDNALKWMKKQQPAFNYWKLN